jgi:predicted translation initiation factor SUI1
VRHDTRRYGKPVTIVEGFDLGGPELERIGSELKRRLAVGGSVADGRIQLQGRHDARLRRALDDLGFAVDERERRGSRRRDTGVDRCRRPTSPESRPERG